MENLFWHLRTQWSTFYQRRAQKRDKWNLGETRGEGEKNLNQLSKLSACSELFINVWWRENLCCDHLRLSSETNKKDFKLTSSINYLTFPLALIHSSDLQNRAIKSSQKIPQPLRMSIKNFYCPFRNKHDRITFWRGAVSLFFAQHMFSPL